MPGTPQLRNDHDPGERSSGAPLGPLAMNVVGKIWIMLNRYGALYPVFTQCCILQIINNPFKTLFSKAIYCLVTWLFCVA